MKSIIILGDGMADEPIEALGGKTPMQYADTPYMDKLAEMGVTGRMKTVADGFHPGSEVANMAVLGYDLPTVYEGRGFCMLIIFRVLYRKWGLIWLCRACS